MASSKACMYRRSVSYLQAINVHWIYLVHISSDPVDVFFNMAPHLAGLTGWWCWRIDQALLHASFSFAVISRMICIVGTSSLINLDIFESWRVGVVSGQMSNQSWSASLHGQIVGILTLHLFAGIWRRSTGTSNNGWSDLLYFFLPAGRVHDGRTRADVHVTVHGDWFVASFIRYLLCIFCSFSFYRYKSKRAWYLVDLLNGTYIDVHFHKDVGIPHICFCWLVAMVWSLVLIDVVILWSWS